MGLPRFGCLFVCDQFLMDASFAEFGAPHSEELGVLNNIYLFYISLQIARISFELNFNFFLFSLTVVVCPTSHIF
jgi:hypothetical protein